MHRTLAAADRGNRMRTVATLASGTQTLLLLDSGYPGYSRLQHGWDGLDRH